MPKNTDAQKKRKQDAFQSAIVSSCILVASAVVMLTLYITYLKNSFWGAVLVIFSLLELGSVIPVWILLKNRLKEIEGGEEDAAAEY